jgi:hypothetical protein
MKSEVQMPLNYSTKISIIKINDRSVIDGIERNKHH